MKKYPADFCPKTRRQLLFREMDDGAVVYEAGTEKVHTLNPSAAYIWALCNGNYNVQQISTQIRRDFASLDAHPEEEVQNILASFDHLGLLENS